MVMMMMMMMMAVVVVVAGAIVGGTAATGRGVRAVQALLPVGHPGAWVARQRGQPPHLPPHAQPRLLRRLRRRAGRGGQPGAGGQTDAAAAATTALLLHPGVLQGAAVPRQRRRHLRQLDRRGPGCRTTLRRLPTAGAQRVLDEVQGWRRASRADVHLPARLLARRGGQRAHQRHDELRPGAPAPPHGPGLALGQRHHVRVPALLGPADRQRGHHLDAEEGPAQTAAAVSREGPAVRAMRRVPERPAANWGHPAAGEFDPAGGQLRADRADHPALCSAPAAAAVEAPGRRGHRQGTRAQPGESGTDSGRQSRFQRG